MRRRSRGVATGAVLAVLLLGFAGTASAADSSSGPKSPPPRINAGATGDHSQVLEAQQPQTGHDPGPAAVPAGVPASGTTNQSGPTTSPYPPAGPYGSYADAFPKNPNADLSWMPGAVDACGSTWGGDGWNAQYAEATPCDPAAPATEEPPGPPQITTAMVVAAASAVAPMSPPHVEPGTRSAVNIPNNYWTDAPTVDTSLTLLGVTIPLRWVPTGTTWDFGDGTTATGNGVANAEVGAPGAVEHAYTRGGDYAISTSTSYDLTFVLPGQGPQTVALTSPPSPPVPLEVGEIQTRTTFAR